MRVHVGIVQRRLFKLTWEVLTGDKTWIYRYDSETKMQSAVQLFRASHHPLNSKGHTSHRKKCRLFLRKIGHVATIPAEDKRTVTADWYVYHCLSKVSEVWCQRRPKAGLRGLSLHHDNANAHTAATTVDFVNESDLQPLPHPP